MRRGLAVFAAIWPLLLAGCGKAPPTAQASPRQGTRAVRLVVPTQGAYTGAYINFGEAEDNVTLEAVEEFEDQTGKHQAIVAFSSFWGEGRFPTEAAGIVEQHGSIPLLFWSPWDRPYSEEQILEHGPDKFNLNSVLQGQWDTYIDQWADGAKAMQAPILVSLCNEMNGEWFPWAAKYYGAGQAIAGSSPVRFVGPEYFKRAYKYIVDRVRARGASNIRWVFHVNNFSEPYEPWNTCAQMYPGSDYVDWLGLSVYGQQFPGGKWDSFESVMRGPYEELCKLDPDKPMMLTEWGVGEFPASGDKGLWIKDAFTRLEHDYPRVHAAIYWHERWQNARTLLFSNLKVNSSPGALAAYREGLASPFWLGNPIFQ